MIKKHKRRTVIIKGSFQLRMAVIAFISSLLATLIIGITIYVNINKLLQAFNIDPEFAVNLRFINNILFLVMLIYTIIVFASSFFFTHKIAGPLFRFEKSCEEIQNGNLSFRIKLRGNDAMQELQEKFNLMMDSIQSKISKIDRLCAELEISGETHKLKKIRDALKKEFQLLPQKFR